MQHQRSGGSGASPRWGDMPREAGQPSVAGIELPPRLTISTFSCDIAYSRSPTASKASRRPSSKYRAARLPNAGVRASDIARLPNPLGRARLGRHRIVQRPRRQPDAGGQRPYDRAGAMPARDLERRFRVPVKGFRLAECDPGDTAGLDKDKERKRRERDLVRLAELQERLYAEGTRSLLVVLQAMDAAGKDGTIDHVDGRRQPAGLLVTSFKAPTPTELAHDFLWRTQLALPARGHIGVFNRSHYEEVLVVRVHPEFLAAQELAAGARRGRRFWKGATTASSPGSAISSATAPAWSSSSSTSRRPSSASASWPGLEEGARTGSSPPATSPSAPTGTPTRRPTRTRCAPPAPTDAPWYVDPRRPQVVSAHRRGLDRRRAPGGDGPAVSGAVPAGAGRHGGRGRGAASRGLTGARLSRRRRA